MERMRYLVKPVAKTQWQDREECTAASSGVVSDQGEQLAGVADPYALRKPSQSRQVQARNQFRL